MHVYYIINCTKSYRYPFYDEDKKSCLYNTKKKKIVIFNMFYLKEILLNRCKFLIVVENVDQVILHYIFYKI